jgi:hypothetical protein
MVRIWNTNDMTILQRQRFLGLHNEDGIAYNSLMRQICWSHYPTFFKYLQENYGFKIGYINHPEVQRFRNRVAQLVDLHDNLIVPDFQRRGYNHQSPLPTANCLCMLPKRFTFTSEQQKIDHAELMRRQGEVKQ